MSLRSTITISVCLLFFYRPAGKKEQLLKLCKKYFPGNYVVLKEYDESLINGMANGNSLNEYVYDIPTVVHEGYHSYTSNHSSYYDSLIVFRINDTLSFSVKKIKTFPSIQVNAIVPDSLQKKIFRYTTYIDSKDKYLVTQQFGILGLLEEMAAYYQSYHTNVALFKYHRDDHGWKNTKPWMEYLGRMASYRYSITEFELFVSWYLQYALAKHRSVYNDITSNKGLKQMLIFLHNENIRLASLYDDNRQEILKNFSKQLVTGDNYIYDKNNHNGTGLYDNEVKEMNELLSKPEHKLYRDLLQ
ncbi:MAG: hypothetical protein HOP10_00830 [Chitinophagaceae bacterium]|nr:hypothetical protein [Chitinophagaceae bacterium]